MMWSMLWMSLSGDGRRRRNARRGRVRASDRARASAHAHANDRFLVLCSTHSNQSSHYRRHHHQIQLCLLRHDETLLLLFFTLTTMTLTTTFSHLSFALLSLLVGVIFIARDGAASSASSFDFRHQIANREEEFAAAYIATVSEVEKRGGFVSPAIEYRRGPHGAAYFAVRDIPANEHLITVPVHSTTEYEDIRKRFPDLNSWRGPVQPNGDRSLYALYLATDGGSGERPFYSWMFPRACANSVTFSAKVFRNPRLTSPYIMNAYNGLRARAFTDYDLLRANVPHYMANVTRAHYRLAYCWFETRSFGSRLVSEGTAALVPLADLVNHAADHSMSWMFDDATEKWIFYNIRPIPAGEELFDNYGDSKDAANLLMTYGFSASNNMADTQQLEVRSSLLRSALLSLQLERRPPHVAALALQPLVAAARRNYNQTLFDVQQACEQRTEAVRNFITNCYEALGANKDPVPQVEASLHGLLSYYRTEFDVIQRGCAALIENISQL